MIASAPRKSDFKTLKVTKTFPHIPLANMQAFGLDERTMNEQPWPEEITYTPKRFRYIITEIHMWDMEIEAEDKEEAQMKALRYSRTEKPAYFDRAELQTEIPQS